MSPVRARIGPVRLLLPLAALATSLALPATASAAPVPLSSTPTATPTGSVHVVAVGDVARAGGGQTATARLVAAHRPQAVLLLGDLAYDTGSAADFTSWFAPSYGRFRSITWPVPGNHEYGTRGAAGYRAYFRVVGPTWWVRRTGAWTVIGLDSEQVTSSAQRSFLLTALRSNRGRPTVVAWHRPRVSSGAHGGAADTQPLYALVAADPDVRIILWGHDHDYQRMSLPFGARAPLTAFVVGTGGAELRPVTRPAPAAWSRKVVAGRYGVLDLVLRPRSFSFTFTSVDGVVRDSGSSAF